MSFCLGCVALSALYKNGKSALVFILLHCGVFQTLTAPTHWVYIPEILSDQQLGFVLTCHYMNGVEISLVTEYMIKFLGTDGTFFFYSAINFLGGIFMFCFLRETFHLTDRQKKTLYVSKS